MRWSDGARRFYSIDRDERAGIETLVELTLNDDGTSHIEAVTLYY